MKNPEDVAIDLITISCLLFLFAHVFRNSNGDYRLTVFVALMTGAWFFVLLRDLYVD